MWRRVSRALAFGFPSEASREASERRAQSVAVASRSQVSSVAGLAVELSVGRPVGARGQPLSTRTTPEAAHMVHAPAGSNLSLGEVDSFVAARAHLPAAVALAGVARAGVVAGSARRDKAP